MMNVYSDKFDIEELLLNKSIDELSPEERRYVLDRMSLDEFSDCREVLNDSIDLFNIESDAFGDSSHIQEDLVFRLKQKSKLERKTISSFKELINYRIPVYKAAFASIAIICMVYFFDYSLQQQNGIIFGNDSTANENIMLPMIDTLDSTPNKDKGDSLVSSTDFQQERNLIETFISDSVYSVAVPIAKFCLNGIFASEKKAILRT